ncbi:SDR family oxidoreductase [Mycobacterium sp. SMC-15]|uniref:SDR family oxidoreductase n=1 Tax=Mycobacterium sp. SMC-15 TaxID=3381627 RepID=UPI0038768F5B
MSKRIAIVTGASTGIGRATAVRFAARGYRLVLNARDSEALAVVADDLTANGCELTTIVGDAAEPETVDRLVSVCQERFGSRPSIGMVNAGGGLPGTLLTSDPARWEDLFRVNVLGALRQMRAFATAMLPIAEASPLNKALDIVVTGSTVGTNVSPFNTVYGASKFAVHGAAEGLRREVGPIGIRVSLIEPGIVATNFQAAAGYDAHWFSTYSEEIGPVLDPDDVARAIEFVTDQPPHVHLGSVVLRPTRQPYP